MGATLSSRTVYAKDMLCVISVLAWLAWEALVSMRAWDGNGSWWTNYPWSMWCLTQPILCSTLCQVLNLVSVSLGPWYCWPGMPLWLFHSTWDGNLLATWSLYLTRFVISICLPNPVYHQVAFAAILITATLRTIALTFDLPPGHPARRTIGKMMAWGIVTFATGFGIWNVDNIFCEQLRAIRTVTGPFGVLVEGGSSRNGTAKNEALMCIQDTPIGIIWQDTVLIWFSPLPSVSALATNMMVKLIRSATVLHCLIKDDVKGYQIDGRWLPTVNRRPQVSSKPESKDWRGAVTPSERLDWARSILWWEVYRQFYWIHVTKHLY